MPRPTVPLHRHQKLQLRTTNLETLAAIDTVLLTHYTNQHQEDTHPHTISPQTRLALQQLATLDPDEAQTLEERIRYNDQSGALNYRNKLHNRLTT